MFSTICFLLCVSCRIPPNLADWILCNGLVDANQSTWYKLYNMYKEKQDDNILIYLTCTNDPRTIADFLYITYSTDVIILDEETYRAVFYSILERHADNDTILEYILENVNAIASR